MLTRSSLTRSRQAQPSGSRMTSVQPWSVQGSRRSRRVSPPRSRRVSPPRSRRVSPPRSCRSDRSDRDRYGIILCARRPVGQRDCPRTRVEVSTSTGVSASRPPPTASPPPTAAGASPSTSIKGATARPSRVIPRSSGKTAIKPADRPAHRVSASLGARSSPRSRLRLSGARPSAFDHNAGPLASSTSMKGKDCAGSSSAQIIAKGMDMPFVHAAVMGRERKTPIEPSVSPVRANRAGPLAFTGHCSPLRGREAAEAAALLHTGLPLPIALSRGKRLADLIAKLSKDSDEAAATAAEREAVASLSLKDMKAVIFFYYLTCEHQILSYNAIVRGITMRMVHPKVTLKRELIAIRTRCCSDGGKKFDLLYAIALEHALKGLATLLQIREEEECMDMDRLLGQSKTELLEWPLLYGSSHGRRKSN